MQTYADFLTAKQQLASRSGFPPTFTPSWLFDFQADLVDWAVRKGRAAIFADCGMGKTPIQLVWAQNVVEHANRPVLILAPLAASAQTVREADKFGIAAVRSLDGASCGAQILVTNYERLHLFSPADFAGVVCDESSILKNFEGATKAAVTEFQKEYLPDLNPTGETGASTRQKLNELCQGSTSSSQNLAFTLVTINQPQLVQTANLLKNYWQSVGVTVQINAV